MSCLLPDFTDQDRRHSGVIMSMMASQITNVSIAYSTVYSGPDQGPLWGEFTDDVPAQRASNAENVSIWWRHHAFDHGYPLQWIFKKIGKVYH